MRTLCDACESAPAILFCAADEAALCRSCDEKVHMCNKLASRHVRVGLSDQSYVRRCEICENSPAFFYCAIDGSSLCSQCDVTVHVGGKRTHERYLLLRQRVEFPGTRPASGENLALQLTDPVESRQEQNQLPKLAIEGNLQNHKVSAVPILNVNVDNHRKMDSPMIDLNTRPQRVHEQSSNAQLGLSHQGDLWGNPSYQQPGSPIHGPDLSQTKGPRIPYISLHEGPYISSIAGAGDGCFKW